MIHVVTRYASYGCTHLDLIPGSKEGELARPLDLFAPRHTVAACHALCTCQDGHNLRQILRGLARLELRDVCKGGDGSVEDRRNGWLERDMEHDEGSAEALPNGCTQLGVDRSVDQLVVVIEGFPNCTFSLRLARSFNSASTRTDEKIRGRSIFDLEAMVHPERSPISDQNRCRSTTRLTPKTPSSRQRCP